MSAPLAHESQAIERWPTEWVLFALSVAASLLIWVALFVSLIGIVYVAMFAAFFFVAHVLLVATVRGNGVRLGPEQFPELYARVEQLAGAFGMKRVPEAYLMQAGGALNAFATRFLRANMIVLYSDLLEACQGNTAARDMIIAHELGHLAAGHLRFRWLTLPAQLIPFLGTALSRAREYTCDRYGAVGAGDRSGAVLGLTVLAAGGKLAPKVNLQAFAQQRGHMETGWMTIGEWLSTHPPLCRRIAAIDRTLEGAGGEWRMGAARALGILAAIVGLGVGAAMLGGRALQPLFQRIQEQSRSRVALQGDDNRRNIASADLAGLAGVIDDELDAHRPPPATDEELDSLWRHKYGFPAPVDPFGMRRYGYEVRGTGYRLSSAGPDETPGTGDDIVLPSGSEVRRFRR